MPLTTGPTARTAACLLVGLVLFGGCKAQLRQTVTVRSADRFELTAQLRFAGPAAKALTDRPELRSRLDALIRARSPKATHHGDDRLQVWDAPLEPAQLAELGRVTGLQAARLSGRNPVTLTLEIASPTDLRRAIAQVPDAAAVPVMLKNTELITEVRFGGRITEVGGTLADTATRPDPRRAVLTTTLDRVVPGTLTVSGDPHAPANRAPYLVGGALLLGMVALLSALRGRTGAPR